MNSPIDGEGSHAAAGDAFRRGPDAPGFALPPSGSTALLTDHYELTMLRAALESGAASRPAVFEVFARSLPSGRRYGVIAGTGRFPGALERFFFGEAELAALRERGVIDEASADWLATYRFSGSVHGLAEGEAYF